MLRLLLLLLLLLHDLVLLLHLFWRHDWPMHRRMHIRLLRWLTLWLVLMLMRLLRRLGIEEVWITKVLTGWIGRADCVVCTRVHTRWRWEGGIHAVIRIQARAGDAVRREWRPIGSGWRRTDITAAVVTTADTDTDARSRTDTLVLLKEGRDIHRGCQVR